MDEEKDLQQFLIRNFTIMLITVVVLELVLTALLNSAVMPYIKHHMQWSLKGQGLLKVSAVWLLYSFMNAIMSALSIPASAENSWMTLFVSQQIGLTQNQIMSVSDSDRMALTLIMIAVFAIMLLPVVLGASIYARVVGNKVHRTQIERDQDRLKFDRQKNLMLSDIAHDLRTPITTISGYAKALNDGMVTDEAQKREYLAAIEKKTDRMSELINLLFEYVKLDSEGYTLNLEEVDLCELFRSCGANLFPEIEEHEMELVVQIPQTPYYVFADKLQLSRVATNLLSNAIRHNPMGSRILLALDTSIEGAYLIVADNGNPIPEDLAEHIFDPFSMGDESRNSRGGSGLGLSIAQKIINMHDGNIRYQEGYAGYTKAFMAFVPKAAPYGKAER
ncbi:MAG: HAMP domain-containing histidine kinase [Clostridiales bacterium]|nr:HAMP domain-containing histidine kinase [Clostridiales bacterium]